MPMRIFTKWMVISQIAFILSGISLSAQQTTYNFTTAGATGQYGPTQAQVNTAYASTPLNGQVTVNNGIQSWTVPYTGTYIITTAGAAGGSSAFSAAGSGAVISTQLNLTAGQVLNIVVGQSGQSNGSTTQYFAGGSGGGGSFVYTGAIGGPGLIEAAGGGGGALASPHNPVASNVSNGNFATYGDTIVNEGGYISPGGVLGNGGGFSTYNQGYCAGPGSGWYSDYNPANGGSTPTLGGIRFTGGTPDNNGMPGGFGGGGASGDNVNSIFAWAGGGGGYSGGGAGSNDGGYDGQVGGGGGSFASFAHTNVALNNGDGYVSIAFVNITCTVNPTTFCAGSTFKVPYFTSGTFSTGNVFTAQLSDASGSFTSPVNIGSKISTVNDSITVTIPLTQPGGTGYRIRIIASNPADTGIDNGSDITINQAPMVGGYDDQEGYVCPGSTVTLYGYNAVSYVWSNGVTDGNPFIIDSTTTYQVTGTDENGCWDTSSVTVYVYQPPVVGIYISPAGFICADSLVTLNGTGASTYQWNNGVTDGVSFIPPVTATYTVTGTDQNGCTGTDSTLIVVHNNPIANVGPNVSQCGGFVPLDAGNPDSLTYHYLWSDNETTKTIIASTSGDYAVTVTTQFGCRAFSQKNVYIKPSPIVNLGSDTTQCGGNIALNAGNPGDTFNWSTGETTQTIIVSSTSAYSVTVTDPNSSCSGSSSINVIINAVPSVNLGPDINQCGGTAVLDAGNQGASYAWSNLATTETITARSSGTYVVTVTNANCSGTGSVSVYINSVPVVNLGPDVRQCSGHVTLDAGNNNFTYLWSTSSDSNIIIADSTATYYVSVTDPNTLCTSTDSIHVTIDTLPVVNLGTDTTQCGGSITLNAGNAGSVYLWSDGSSADTLSVTASGTYRVTVTNSNGCTGTGSIFVVINPIPVVTLSLPANVCSTASPFALSGGLPMGGIYYEADSIISTFAPNQQGVGLHEITYVFSNVFGCSDSDSASIFVRPQPGITTTPIPYICTTSAEINLNNYFSPAGGFYFGVGVSSNLFYPSLAPAGMDTIVDIYTDNFGCKDTAAYPLNVHPPVHVTLTSSVADFTICQNQSITFTSTGATDYQFYVNGVAQGAPSTDSTFTTTTLANHSEVIVIGSNPCSVDTSEPIIIDVINPPVVYAGNDTTITLGQTVQLHGIATGTGSLVYEWTPGNGLNFVNVPNPTYSGSDSITFTLKATDTYGCADSAKVSVYVFIPDNVQLPTVITPNGDGYNDIWKLNAKIDLDGSHLVIFDRWGQVVYETENYANNWGGTYKSTGQLLPDGTYYYVLKVPAQHNHVYEGPINIISGSTK